MSALQFPREDIIGIYRSMRMIRRFEERLMEEMATGDIPGNTQLYAGQEASAVGVCLALNPEDFISSTHRGHGHSIAKGCEIDAMMGELFGRATGTCGGKGGSQHIADLRKGIDHAMVERIFRADHGEIDLLFPGEAGDGRQIGIAALPDFF